MPRLWYPEILIDEELPEPRASAEAWLEPDADGHTSIYFDEITSTPVAVWKPGERVEFGWFEHLGSATLRILPDGSIATTFRCGSTIDLFAPDAPASENVVPTGANWFWCLDENEICDGSIEAFARQYAETAYLPEEVDGHDVVVAMGHWENHLPFIISADGKSLTAATEEL